MNSKARALIFIFSLMLYFFASTYQESPGYMDADYHLYMGQRLSNNFGFSENILWNYLDDPSGLPHPSHTYWSPLASLLAALGIRLFSSLEVFQAARIPFILLAALVPVLTSEIAFRMVKERLIAIWAAIFSLAAPFYLPYLMTTDSFTLSMFLGAMLFLILIWKDKDSLSIKSHFSIGLITGLLFLTRAEGLIWLALILFLSFIDREKNIPKTPAGSRNVVAIMLGFLLVASPWLWRNLQSFGQLFPPGSIRSLWLTNYDDLFAFPVQSLNLANWLSSGFAQIAETIIWAIGQNLIGSVVILGSILLTPMLMFGIWKYRHHLAIRLSVLAWIASLILMSIVFPFQGVRGGFFHAGAAIQPMIWALSAIGLHDLISRAQKKRGWNVRQSQNILGGGLILILSILSVNIFSSRVIGERADNPIWNQSAQHYAKITEYFAQKQILNEQVILVNNPPGWALQSNSSAIVIPNENERALLELADQFAVSLLILEENHPALLDALYKSPKSNPNFQWLVTIEGSHIFQILRD